MKERGETIGAAGEASTTRWSRNVRNEPFPQEGRAVESLDSVESACLPACLPRRLGCHGAHLTAMVFVESCPTCPWHSSLVI